MQTFRGAEDVSLQPNGEVCFFLVSVSDSKKREIKGRFAKTRKLLLCHVKALYLKLQMWHSNGHCHFLPSLEDKLGNELCYKLESSFIFMVAVPL